MRKFGDFSAQKVERSNIWNIEDLTIQKFEDLKYRRSWPTSTLIFVMELQEFQISKILKSDHQRVMKFEDLSS